ncbi:MAG: hypothetical protein ACI8Z5_002453 [Lentimonas sp.]
MAAFFAVDLKRVYAMVNRVTMMAKFSWVFQLVGLLCVGLFAFVLGYFLIPVDLGIEIVRYGTKPLFYFVYAAVCYFSLREIRASFGARGNIRFQWCVFIAALLGVLFVTTRDSYEYKVLSDEYVICAQAKSLHLQGTSDYPVGTFSRYGEVKPSNSLVDKRPPSFSVLLAVIHDLSGYRVGNVFILNSLICFGLVWLLLHVARACAPDGFGQGQQIAWVLCLLFSLPLLGQVATGAGMDLYNLFLLAASAFLAWRVLEESDSKHFLLWLAVSFLLFNARYESVLYVLSVGGVLLLQSYRIQRIPAFTSVCLIPLGLIAFLLRHRVFDVLPEISWQLDEGVTSAFSFSYFYQNVGHALSYLYVIDIQSSASCLLSYFGTVAILVLTVRGVRELLAGKKPSNRDVVLIAYGGVVAVNFLLLMCYHWGRIDELEVSRLALPLFLLFGACIYRVLEELYRGRQRVAHALLSVAVVYVVLVAIPSVSSELRLKNNYHAQIDAWALEQMEAQADPAALIVTEGSLFWDLHVIAAQHPSDVMSHLQDFEFHRVNRSFNAYLLEQIKRDPLTGTLTVLGGSELGSLYSTEVVAEMPYKPYHYARLSKVLEPKVGMLSGGELQGRDLEFYQQYPIEYWFLRIW